MLLLLMLIQRWMVNKRSDGHRGKAGQGGWKTTSGGQVVFDEPIGNLFLGMEGAFGRCWLRMRMRGRYWPLGRTWQVERVLY